MTARQLEVLKLYKSGAATKLLSGAMITLILARLKPYELRLVLQERVKNGGKIRKRLWCSEAPK
jgi:hypothetical protein